VHVPLEPGSGLSARDQCRAGRTRLLTTPYADLERDVRQTLQRMLGPGGFSEAADILAITVNRWSHGYSYSFNTLDDEVEEMEANIPMGRARVGRIAFANSDTAWSAYAHSAMSEGHRAVSELLKG
jgi:spermidine dehydrogenase